MTTHTLSTKPGDAASPDLCSLDPTELSVSGMSCASCAAKVERALNEQVGVTATVNYATASAYINRDSTTLTVDDLIGVVEGLGYGAEPAPTDNDDLEEAAEADDAAAKAQVHDLKIRFWVSAALALPVMVISMVPAWQFRGWQWVALALTTPVVVWGALPFHRATLTNLRHGTTTMDTLVSLGVLAAYGWSLWALFFGGAGELGMKMDMSWLPATTGSGGMGDMPGMDHTSGAAPHELYLEVAAVVPTFLLGGRWAEARAKRRAGSALRSLLRLGAQEARVVAADGTEVTVPASAVNVGQLLVVRPGERVPTDGEVTGGTSTIDASLLTGESVPVEVVPGDAITGATVNLSGRLEMRATRVGSDTQLARMGRLVRDAQAGKADAQRLADRVSAVFVPIVLLIAAATLTAWLALGQPVDAAIAAAVAVLVIACPCALGLATPTALLVGTGRGSQLGLLISGPQVLEATRDIDVMVLDKTGTITEGIMSLVDVVPGPGTERAELLRLVGSAESGSEHPIAAAITDAARYELGDLPPVESLTNHPGLGVRATVISSGEHTLVLVGRPGLLADEGLVWPEGLRSRGRVGVGRGHGGRRRLGRHGARVAHGGRHGAARQRAGDRRAHRAQHHPVDGHRRCRAGGSGGCRAGGHRPRSRRGRGHARGQGRHRRSASGRGAPCGHGGRWGQRCRRVGHCRFGHRHGFGCRRGDGGVRPHHRVGCADGHRRCHPAVALHAGHHQGQPVLGLRLQRGCDPAGRGRPPHPADRRVGHGGVIGAGGAEQPAAAPVPTHPVARPGRGIGMEPPGQGHVKRRSRTGPSG